MGPDDIVIELLSEPQPGDPYPPYHALREQAPNHPNMLGCGSSPATPGCTELRRSHDSPPGSGWPTRASPTGRFKHTRLRRLVGLAFSPRHVEGVVPKLLFSIMAAGNETTTSLISSG